jgi:hypothetical protein
MIIPVSRVARASGENAMKVAKALISVAAAAAVLAPCPRRPETFNTNRP